MCRELVLSELINAAMIKRDMHQIDIVKATGLSSAVVSQIVSGTTKNPTFTNVIKIANALNMPLDYFAGKIPLNMIK